MPNHNEPDFRLDSGVVIEVKSDMRDKLVANLRSQARQSRYERQAQIIAGKRAGKRPKAAAVRISVAGTEPQSVLIKNRSEHLRNEVLRLRSRYAKLLTKESGD